MYQEEIGKPIAIVNLPTLVKDELLLRNYSSKTIKSYSSCIRAFIQYFQPRQSSEFTYKNIRRYLLYLLMAKQTAPATLNQVFSANPLVLLHAKLTQCIKPAALGREGYGKLTEGYITVI